MANRSTCAAWIGLLAVAAVAQVVVTIVRTRHDGSVPVWSVVAAVAIAGVLFIRIREWRRLRDGGSRNPERH